MSCESLARTEGLEPRNIGYRRENEVAGQAVAHLQVQELNHRMKARLKQVQSPLRWDIPMNRLAAMNLVLRALCSFGHTSAGGHSYWRQWKGGVSRESAFRRGNDINVMGREYDHRSLFGTTDIT